MNCVLRLSLFFLLTGVALGQGDHIHLLDITGDKKDGGGFKHPGGEKILKTAAFRNGIAARINRK